MKRSTCVMTWAISATLLATMAACSDAPAVASAAGGDAADGAANQTDAKGADAATGDTAMMMPQTQAPSAATAAILAKIKDYHSWPKFAENATPKLSQSHMKMWVVTYHNDVVTQAIANKTLPLPDGAILVKDNGMSADDPMPMPTIMAKQGGQWYWIEATPDGKVVIDEMMDKGKPLEGHDVKMCTGCHAAQKDKNDWIFVHDFGK
ncbi:MAG: hypothetical protein HY902_03385 [Deltaproteobacteria bacterium]|nr:hypothetical protein [Deltaproteobacteria bacterium]